MEGLLNATAVPSSPTADLLNGSSFCPGWTPLPQTTIIPAAYAVICLVGVVGNALAIYVLAQGGGGGGGRQTVANTFMLNLCVSDLLLLLSLPLWAVSYARGFHWPFGRLACKLCGGVLHLNIYASIFFIVCMSVDRYLAIVHPLRSQRCRNPCRARVACGVAWGLAWLCTTPALVLRGTSYHEQLGVEVCGVFYPDESWYLGLAWAKIVLAFLLPLVVLSSCYCVIGRHLLAGAGGGAGRRGAGPGPGPPLPPGPADSKESRGKSEERPPPGPLVNTERGTHGAGPRRGWSRGGRGMERVLWTVAAVVLAFFLCWFPFHCLALLELLRSHGLLRGCLLDWAIQNLTGLSLCLGLSNSAVNPVLYCFVGNHFRGRLGALCKGLCACLSPRGEEQGDQKRGSFSTRLSSFSRKLSDLKDLALVEAPGIH